ncbi:MAG: UDP-N-acetylmuramoyl-tripeptide--D-alanyl-D-alanine ligase [Gammaproteobacteria bacterium]|nr:UDP-N-acetylmuramoyl-tripeptide--D-alanyl-D-alanine ligase [Gammaproteobacteria bacterium]
MMEGTLMQAAESMHGVLCGTDRSFRGVSTDTRTLQAGELFFALEGPNFDGNRFVDVAAQQDAAAAVVTRNCDADLPSIAVENTRLALGRLAAAWRRQNPATVIGITGSNGKTTLKELLAACLSQSAPTLATQGNLNNDIGVPLMLLRIEPGHRFAVIEMGANHHGEIEYLTRLAEPDVVVITNAAPAHLEGFGSLVGVSRAKGEILKNAVRPRCAVLNADDRFYDYWRSLVEDIELVTFGIENPADVFATDINCGPGSSQFTLHVGDAELQIDLPLPGAHNVLHACAAAAIAHRLGIGPELLHAGLESAAPVAGRLQPVQGIRGSVLYDDSYNANPASVIAAAAFLASEDGRSYLVLGDMGELGDDAAELHEEVGFAVKKAGVDFLLATGELSKRAVAAFGAGASWFSSVAHLADSLSQQVDSGSNVLVKGSRSMRMERVVEALRDTSAERRGG